MTKVTKKGIISAVKAKTGYNVALVKNDGFYYWSGESTSSFSEANTFMNVLSDWDIDSWVEDFESKLENTCSVYDR